MGIVSDLQNEKVFHNSVDILMLLNCTLRNG